MNILDTTNACRWHIHRVVAKIFSITVQLSTYNIESEIIKLFEGINRCNGGSNDLHFYYCMAEKVIEVIMLPVSY